MFGSFIVLTIYLLVKVVSIYISYVDIFDFRNFEYLPILCYNVENIELPILAIYLSLKTFKNDFADCKRFFYKKK